MEILRLLHLDPRKYWLIYHIWSSNTVPFGGNTLSPLYRFLPKQITRTFAQEVAGGAVGADLRALKANARHLLDSRRFNEAVSALNEALELQPSDAEAHVLLGRAQANLGHLDLAEVRLAVVCFRCAPSVGYARELPPCAMCVLNVFACRVRAVDRPTTSTRCKVMRRLRRP